ncbi:MAG: AAA family ATPase [Brevinematales bacterium]|nr:AAA family ATPase [Brevinematales bacterium]
MIRRLKLSSFGRFRNASFEFGKTTLFVGPNESGKTTLFDALALGLCQKGRGEMWETIQDRYKKNNTKVPLPEMELEEPLVLDYNHFFSFFAVRASGNEIVFDSRKNWVSEMRSRLLFGGYDITSLKQHFESMVTSRRNDAYPKKIEEITKAMETLRQQIELLEREARGYQKTLEEFQKFKTELQTKKEKEEILRRERDACRIQQEEVEKSLEAVRMAEWLTRYEEYREKRDDLQRQYAGLSEEEISELEKKREELKAWEERLKSQDMELATWYNKLEAIRPQMVFVEEERKNTEETSRKGRRKALLWRGVGGGLMVLSLGAVGGMIVFSSVPWYIWFGIAMVGAVFAGLSFLMGMFFGAKAEENVLKQKMEALYTEAQRIGLLSFRPANWEAFVSEIEKQKHSWAERKQKGEEEKTRFHQEKEAFEKQENDFCSAYRVSSLAVAKKLLSEKKEKEAELQGLQRGLESFDGVEKSLSFEENARRIRARVSILPLPREKDLATLQGKREEGKKRLMELERELENLHKTREESTRKEVELSASLMRLEESMQRYAKLRQEEKRLEEKKNQLEREKMAYERLCSLFQEIETEQSSVFEFLSTQVKEEFGDIYPAFQDIQLKSFGKEGMLFSDVLGEKRPVKFLSQGTQDLFYLALRLFLGQRMWENTQPGVFVFDEPFASLDEERKQVALRLLLKFQKKYDWQYVIFTKDETLPHLMKEMSWEVVMYRLQRKNT